MYVIRKFKAVSEWIIMHCILFVFVIIMDYHSCFILVCGCKIKIVGKQFISYIYIASFKALRIAL